MGEGKLPFFKNKNKTVGMRQGNNSMSTENKNVKRIIAESKTALTNELEEKMIGLSDDHATAAPLRNPILGFKKVGGHMEWLPVEGSNANYRNLKLEALSGSGIYNVAADNDGKLILQDMNTGSGPSMIQGQWKYVAHPANPASGQWSTDSTDPGTATTVQLFKRDNNGLDFTNILNAMKSNSQVVLSDISDPTKHYVFMLTSDTITWTGDYVTYQVSVATQGTTVPAAGDTSNLLLIVDQATSQNLDDVANVGAVSSHILSYDSSKTFANLDLVTKEFVIGEIAGIPAPTTTWGNITGTLANQTDLVTALNLKADKSNVLELDNTTSYTPTLEFHPATKKYVDDHGGGTTPTLQLVTDAGNVTTNAIQVGATTHMQTVMTPSTIGQYNDTHTTVINPEGIEFGGEHNQSSIKIANSHKSDLLLKENPSGDNDLAIATVGYLSSHPAALTLAQVTSTGNISNTDIYMQGADLMVFKDIANSDRHLDINKNMQIKMGGNGTTNYPYLQFGIGGENLKIINQPTTLTNEGIVTKAYGDLHYLGGGVAGLWEENTGKTQLNPILNYDHVLIGNTPTTFGKLEVNLNLPQVGDGVVVTNADAGYNGTYLKVSDTLYTLDSTHHLVDSGWFWLMKADTNTSWNGAVAYGAAGNPTPEAVSPYEAYDTGTHTPTVSPGGTSTAIEAITTNGKIYSEEIIKTHKGFELKNNIALLVGDQSGRNIFGVTNTSSTTTALLFDSEKNGVFKELMTLEDDGTATLPTSDIANMDDDKDIITVEYFEDKISTLPLGDWPLERVLTKDNRTTKKVYLFKTGDDITKAPRGVLDDTGLTIQKVATGQMHAKLTGTKLQFQDDAANHQPSEYGLTKFITDARDSGGSYTTSNGKCLQQFGYGRVLNFSASTRTDNPAYDPNIGGSVQYFYHGPGISVAKSNTPLVHDALFSINNYQHPGANDYGWSFDGINGGFTQLTTSALDGKQVTAIPNKRWIMERAWDLQDMVDHDAGITSGDQTNGDSLVLASSGITMEFHFATDGASSKYGPGGITNTKPFYIDKPYSQMSAQDLDIEASTSKALITKEFAELHYSGGGGGGSTIINVNQKMTAAGAWSGGTTYHISVPVTGAVVGDGAVVDLDQYSNAAFVQQNNFIDALNATVSAAGTVQITFRVGSYISYDTQFGFIISVLQS